MVVTRGLSSDDTEETLTGRVQHFQVGESASTTGLEGDCGLNHPAIVFDDGLTASWA
ncbi:MAG: hypothetical protein JWO52_2337 [Gammaproteobacteria bacterium]|nr:hypothetical protein [Gammaproteobacteria bacterium]